MFSSLLKTWKKNEDITSVDRGENQGLYQSLFQYSTDLVYFLNADGFFIEVNDVFTCTLGYEMNELMDHPFHSIIIQNDLSNYLTYSTSVIQGKVQNFNVCVHRIDGAIVELNITYIPIQKENKVTGIYGFAKQIINAHQVNDGLLKTEMPIISAHDLADTNDPINIHEEGLIKVDHHGLDGEGRYKPVFDHNPDASFFVLPNGRIVDVNQSIVRLTGYSKQELYQIESFVSLVDPECLDEALKQFQKVITGESQFFETKIVNKNGESIDLKGMTIPVIEDNQIQGVFGICKDVTEEKQVRHQLVENEEKLQTLIDAMPDFVCFKDELGRWIQANDYTLSFFGLHGVEYYGKTDEELIETKGYLHTCFQSDQQTWESGKMMRFEERMERPNGEVHIFDVIKVPLFHLDGSRKGLVVVGRDITDKKMAEEANAYLVHHDDLTKLPNRRTFEMKLKEALMEVKHNMGKLAVMYLDMDRFKYINDSLGHKIGDRLLQKIADRLSLKVGEAGTLFRMGGDEFAVLLPNIKDNETPIRLAQGIIHGMNTPFAMDDYEFYVTTSIGISTYPHDGEDEQTLIRNADAALYRAKDKGKNGYQIYNSSMSIQDFKTFSLEKDLHKALEENQFELYYQPQVNPKTGRIVGVEALIRWNHPEWGLVSPVEFIPLAEETGLITSIGGWVVQTACKQNKAWQDKGLPPIPISVNLSAQRFMQKELVNNISHILEEANLAGKYFQIEITENTLIDNKQMAISTIAQLQEIGVQISLDDFGTGYSSLSYLKEFNVNFIKLDRSFIKGIHKNAKDSNIIAGLIDISKKLNIRVVAEGVETEEQLQFLTSLDCDQIQGYLFSKPVPAKDFEKLLAKGRLQSWLNQENGQPDVSRRQFFRIELFFPLGSSMTILEINGRKVELGITEVLIEDIGLGGLRFLSNLKLTVRPDITLGFETEILGQIIQLYGHVVWERQVEDDVFQYGLEFTIPETERTVLTQLLNQFSVHIRKNPLVPNCRFITDDKYDYLKNN